jgi:hypothetical protein
MKNKMIHDLAISGMLFAIGLTLPFLTGQIADVGSMILPMHIAARLAGFILRWKYGLVIGASLPIVRSLLFSAPPLYPKAVAMSVELAAYGFFAALFFLIIFKKKNLVSVYASLILSMIIGRAIKGVVSAFLYGTAESPYTLSAFITGTFLEAIPGIIIQLILIPAILVAIKRVHVNL